MRILITGGAGFIGSALIRKIIAESNFSILNIEKLTYASNINALDEVKDSKNYQFLEMDINDREPLAKAFQDFKPSSIMHLAAESHVDNSIEYPGKFVETNVLGTASMLIESYNYWKLLSSELQNSFINYLKNSGITSTFHYLPLDSSSMGCKILPENKLCEVSNNISDRIVRLPLYNNLSMNDQHRIIDKVKDFNL